MIREAAPVTIQLAIAAVLIELLGIPLGVYSALRQYSFWDTTLTTAALIIWGIPVFVLGYFAMYIFGLKLNWLPIGGVGPTVLGVIPSTWESWQTLILPALTLGLIEVAYISYMQRASMLEVSRSDFIRTARAKGLSERKVIWVHGFKNAVIPVMTIAGIDLGALIGGAIITETVFNRPGDRPVDLPRHQRTRHGGHRRRRAVRHVLLRVRQPAGRPRLRLGRPARPSGGLVPDWDDKPQEERDTYGSAWVTEADSVDARRTEEVVEEFVEEQSKPLSLWADTWRRLKRNRLALVGLGIIIVFISIGAVETVFYQAHWHVRAEYRGHRL